jgi:hypothetical protein
MKRMKMQKGIKHHVSEVNIGNHPKQSTPGTHFDKNKLAVSEQFGSKSFYSKLQMRTQKGTDQHVFEVKKADYPKQSTS